MATLTPAAVTRTFLYNGRVLADPDPTMPPEQVKAFYANIHADLTNAVVEGGGFENGTQTYEFKRGIGTKG